MSMSVLALQSHPQLSGAWHTHVSLTTLESSTQYSRAVHGDNAKSSQCRPSTMGWDSRTIVEAAFVGA
jgi:hypothetical protein